MFSLLSQPALPPIPFYIVFYSVVQPATVPLVKGSLSDIYDFKCSFAVKFAIYITWSSLKQLKNASLQGVSGRYVGALEHSSFWSCCFVLWFVCFFVCFFVFVFFVFFLSSPLLRPHGLHLSMYKAGMSSGCYTVYHLNL